MKQKTAAEWQAFIDELTAQKSLVARKIADAELVRARNRLAAFDGEKKAKQQYDAAGADVVEFTRQLDELSAAINQAHAEARRAAHAAELAAAENAITATRPLLDEHEKIGAEIDTALAQLHQLLERRERLVGEITRALPSKDSKMRGDVVHALRDEPHRLAGAVPLELCAKLGIPRPAAGARGRYADTAAGKRSRAEGAMKTGLARLAARDPDAALQRAAPAAPERPNELPRDALSSAEPVRQLTPAATGLPESVEPDEANGNKAPAAPAAPPPLDYNRMPLDEFIARHWNSETMTVEPRGDGQYFIMCDDERLRGPMTKEDVAKITGRAAA